MGESKAIREGQGDGRRARTRRALLDAGERLLAEDFNLVSIDDLVAAASVAKGTFYNHFADKGDLFRALVVAVRRELRGTILRETEDLEDPARKMARGFAVAVRYRLTHRRRAMFLLSSYDPPTPDQDDLNAGVIAFVAEGIAKGRFRITTVEAGVLLMFGLIQSCAGRLFVEEEGFATIARVQQLGAILLRGLGLPHNQAETIAAQEVDRIIRPFFGSDRTAALAHHTADPLE